MPGVVARGRSPLALVSRQSPGNRLAMKHADASTNERNGYTWMAAYRCNLRRTGDCGAWLGKKTCPNTDIRLTDMVMISIVSIIQHCVRQLTNSNRNDK